MPNCVSHHSKTLEGMFETRGSLAAAGLEWERKLKDKGLCLKSFKYKVLKITEENYSECGMLTS